MKRVLLFLILLQGGVALAVDTPTPTNTPGLNSVRRETSDQAFYKAMVTVLPSAVPTAYSTPQFVNSQPMRAIDVAKYKLHHARNVNVRGQAACSAGNVYIGAIF